VRSALVAAVPLAGALAGCTSTPEDGLVCVPLAAGRRHALVDFAHFAIASPEADPWAEHRPEDIACPPSARGPETLGELPTYTIVTTACPYTTVVQPSLEDSCQGDSLFIWIWRSALTGPEDATAHVGVRIGDEPIWELAVPIPADADLIVENIPLTRDHPAGTPIYLHVRNHGSNSYELLGLARCNGQCRAE
jgi:hypothetical protein